MSDSRRHPRDLELPRDDRGLATGPRAVRRLQELLSVFLEQKLDRAGADGFVVTLDGSVRSTVATVLAIEATSPEHVFGLVLPANLNDEVSARSAEAVASMLSIDYERLQLQPLLSAFQRVIGAAGEPADDLVALANARERFRMACLYYVSNTTNRLVLGSIDRTQRLLGSMTKHGENGVDIAPLSDVYWTEVQALAAGLDVPEEILERRPRSVDHGENALEQLGVDAATLDSILHFLIDEEDSPDSVATRTGVDNEAVRTIQRWCGNTRHKCHPPLKPSFDL